MAKPKEQAQSQPESETELKDDQIATFQAAAVAIRDAAKWMLGVFGAIGALLVAGIQFSGLGKLEGDALRLALVGAVVGLLGILRAVVGAASVMRPRAWTMSEIAAAPASDPARKALATKPELLSGYPSVETLWSDYDAALQTYGRALRAWATATGASRKANEEAASLAADDVRPFAALTRRLIMWANHFSLLADFRRTQWTHIIPGAAIALVGLVIFTLNASSPASAIGPNLAGLTLPPGTDLSGGSLRSADLSSAVLVQVVLNNVDLSDVDLSDANLSKADLTGANLHGADLSRASLEGVIWSATICPDGTSSNEVGGTCVAHLSVPSDN